MSIQCNLEIIELLKKTQFPKSKNEILQIAISKNNLSEASIIALNNLEDKIFNSIDDVCANVKIVCNLEIFEVLRDYSFPARRDEILKFMEEAKASKLALQKIHELHPDITFNNIEDICK
jgi:hypothetical protein